MKDTLVAMSRNMSLPITSCCIDWTHMTDLSWLLFNVVRGSVCSSTSDCPLTSHLTHLNSPDPAPDHIRSIIYTADLITYTVDANWRLKKDSRQRQRMHIQFCLIWNWASACADVFTRVLDAYGSCYSLFMDTGWWWHLSHVDPHGYADVGREELIGTLQPQSTSAHSLREVGCLLVGSFSVLQMLSKYMTTILHPNDGGQCSPSCTSSMNSSIFLNSWIL